MTQTLPGVTAVHGELGAAMVAAVASIDAYDTQNDRTTVSLWGTI
jgi:hypothetical protein